jgi:hypothetical protein
MDVFSFSPLDNGEEGKLLEPRGDPQEERMGRVHEHGMTIWEECAVSVEHAVSL